ncbi:MAG: redoxin domain-containing protein [Chitinophagaceae bacterium]
MKKLACTLLISMSFLVGMAQPANPATNQELPFRRFPTVIPFKILLTDSTTWFSKDDLAKKPTFIMLFSPDCDHCKHETEDLIKNIDKFKKIQIVMVTPMPFDKMKEFYAHYEINRYKNITMGRDMTFMFPTFYGVKTLPFLAFYDKKGKLIDGFEGSLPIEKVLEKFATN